MTRERLPRGSTTLLQEKQMVPVAEDGADGAATPWTVRYGLIAD
jgi:hypothetical protein